MVSISKETELQTELRLREVIRSATLRVYDGAYAFDEFPLALFDANADPSALALVRDDQVWSQLRPARPHDRERFAVWRFHFPPDVDNSGFVGWLASALKAKFGTGVFVTCGSNGSHGGIFDYWGVPVHLAGPVIQEIKELIRTPAQGNRAEADLNGLMMRAIETGDSSVIGSQTLFHFTQIGATVRGKYEGGRIIAGNLVGYRNGTELKFCFSQLESPSSLQTGKSVCTVRHRNGALELVEDFLWDNNERPPGRNIIREIL